MGTEYLNDAATVLTLALLEGLLSADNALVLAMMVRHLPVDDRNKALRYGVFGAYFFRVVAILLASYLIDLWYAKALGAAYLLYLCAAHFWKRYKAMSATPGTEKMAKSAGFWKTVVLVELMDIAFSIDSIIAAVALTSKLWIVCLGGILGITAMRFIAGYFLKLLDIYRALEVSAYLLVGWIGVKLGIEILYFLANPEAVAAAQQSGGHYHEGMPGWLFWIVMAVIFFGAFLFKNKPNNQPLE